MRKDQQMNVYVAVKKGKKGSPNDPLSTFECVPISEVRIDPSSIPDEVYEVGCRILSNSVRLFFQDPKNQRAYEEWLRTPEGQRASLLTKEDRAKFDTDHADEKKIK